MLCVCVCVLSESEHRCANDCIPHTLSFACFFLGLAYAETLLPVVCRGGGGKVDIVSFECAGGLVRVQICACVAVVVVVFFLLRVMRCVCVFLSLGPVWCECRYGHCWAVPYERGDTAYIREVQR